MNTTSEKPTPVYRDLRFKNEAKFKEWLKTIPHKTIAFKDNGQDLLSIKVADSGEIIDASMQSFVWNGMFVKMDALEVGKAITFYKDGWTEMQFIVESIK